MSERQEFYNKCRQEYQEFIYQGYEYNNSYSELTITYNFAVPGLSEFHPTWTIQKIHNPIVPIDEAKLDELIFSLGMVELVSYWKIACPPKVYVNDRILNVNQIAWWKKQYFHGLGEFYYTNNIEENFEDFMDISCNSEARKSPVGIKSFLKDEEQIPSVLIPVGGGKDSAVSIELLKDKADRYCYIINPRGATTNTVNVAGLENRTIVASRTLDQNMLNLNKQGFLNGHTPYSAIVAFSSVIAAYINGIEYVALSNESSANETTVVGSFVNHQYSKSFEFEADFRSYERAHIASGVEYFSLLRPLAEMQIAKLFSKYKAYHPIFRSCNAGSKEDKWCCHCPKCLFVYIILSPYLSIKELDSIFGARLFEDESLLNDFHKLIGDIAEKPFECVGSRDEVNAALSETIRQYMNWDQPLPFLLADYKDNHELVNTFKSYQHAFEEENAVPEYFKEIVREAIK